MGADRPLTAVILFDGVCNLCNRSVQFIISRDPTGQFKFAPLQSATARTMLAQHGLECDAMESIVLIKNGQAYDKSNAALEIARSLQGLWPALFAFKIIPRFLRDWVYLRVANNRYRWFGRQDECWIPTPDLRARFLE